MFILGHRFHGSRINYLKEFITPQFQKFVQELTGADKVIYSPMVRTTTKIRSKRKRLPYPTSTPLKHPSHKSPPHLPMKKATE